MLKSLLVASAFVCTAVLLAATPLVAAEPLKSGLQTGEMITAIFEPLNITGEHAGEPHCLVCENGLNPVAMIFAREPSERLTKLLAKIDATTAQNKAQQMGSFAVFLNDRDLKKQLEETAKKHSLQQLVLSTMDPAGPEGFEVAKDADVTVVLYRDFAVQANHAFRAGELTDEAIDKIVADLPKILQKYEKKKSSKPK
jgi:hypothetical protein